MSRKSEKDNRYSKKILKVLGQKKAVSLLELENKILDPSPTLSFAKEAGKQKYAITRSLKGLRDAGLIEQIQSAQRGFARLTREGKKKVHSLELEKENQLLSTSWDGQWRIILLDLPEERKSERESLRYLLKKAGFVCLKNSAWISPFPYEHLFSNIKKDLGLTTELMIIVTEKIDDETKKSLFQAFGN